MKLVSACLVGINCVYNGKNRTNQKLLELYKQGELYPVCPEELGGMGTPRPASEIYCGSGAEVLEGKAKVIRKDGTDVTEYFLKGAYEVLKIAKLIGAEEAILKARSPSCGCGKTYDGSFSDTLIDGDGVTAALLKKNGIKVKTDEEI